MGRFQRQDVVAKVGSAPKTKHDQQHKGRNLSDDRSTYQKAYWSEYKTRKRRIFGTVSEAEFAALQARANVSGRSLWAQIWAEAAACRTGRTLADGDVLKAQRELLVELRRIGNNFAQLAKLGHIRARDDGTVSASTSNILGSEAVRQFEALERKIARFDAGLRSGKIEKRDDH